MYRSGEGVPPSTTTARIWYRWAGETGSLYSVEQLANLHAAGISRKDWIEAYRWYEIMRLAAPTLKDPMQRSKRLQAAAAGQKKLTSKLTQAERKEAVEQAALWSPREQADPPMYEAVSKIETPIDYNRNCQRYSEQKGGARELWNSATLRSEDVQLRACLILINELLMRMSCDSRDPEVRELLFYMQYLDRGPGIFERPASTALATTLVIGRYCKPEVATHPELEKFYKMYREFYEEAKQKRAASKS
jgi:hypothetical protein